MEDAVRRYCDAAAANDIDGLLETLAADAELVSPISGRMVFSGEDDLRILAGAVYGSLRGLSWGEPVGDGEMRVALATARVGGVGLGDAMVFELAPDGRIHRVRPHLRPWLGLTVLALMLAVKMASHPGVIWRALGTY